MEQEIKLTDQPESTPEITVPVKYNKEIKELSLEEAGNLAQKGLKFEAIEADYLALKDLAAKENKSVPAFISELILSKRSALKEELTKQCGGNEEMAEKILNLEGNTETSLNLNEVYEAFEDIKSPEDLPSEVLEKATLKGTNALDEYLRYLLAQKKKTRETIKKQKENDSSSTGSLINLKGGNNPETAEFLRGLWK